jgi:hypothetical protein
VLLHNVVKNRDSSVGCKIKMRYLPTVLRPGSSHLLQRNLITNTQYFTGNPPYSFPPYSSRYAAAHRSRCGKGRGTDCRDGCGLINWRVPQGSEASLFAEACDRRGASAFQLAGARVDGRSCRWLGKRAGRDSVQVDSVRETVTSREEVRPMNAVRTWVLSLVVTVGRLT